MIILASRQRDRNYWGQMHNPT